MKLVRPPAGHTLPQCSISSFLAACFLLFSQLHANLLPNSTQNSSQANNTTTNNLGSAADFYPPNGTTHSNNIVTTLTTTLTNNIITNYNETDNSTHKVPPTSPFIPKDGQLPSSRSIPKTFKFTLTSGKFWKFNIKPSSFSSHKEIELRPHGNWSRGNHFIDDNAWFQYEQQQQQLIAWPSLSTKPGVYRFVLVPPGLDFEIYSENFMNIEVIAFIRVELIRPIYEGINRPDIDHLIDHKFSLDLIQRQSSSYPLLINQIIAIFDIIKRSSNNSDSKDGNQTQNSTSHINKGSSLLILNTKPINKYKDVVLINYTFLSEGNSVSVTWSTHPSISNSSIITPIYNCRISQIKETVSKLSNLTSGFSTEDGENSVIYYPLDAQIVNSLAIVPAERGNCSLKLHLLGPCKRAKIVYEFDANKNNDSSLLLPKKLVDIDVLSSPPTTSSTKFASSGTLTTVSSASPSLPDPAAIDSIPISATSSQPPLVSITASTDQVENFTATPAISTENIIEHDSKIIEPLTITPVVKPLLTTLDIPPSQQTTIGPSALAHDTDSKELVSPERTAIKLQPQTKSFANFLDAQTTDSETTMTPTNAATSSAPQPPMTIMPTINSSSVVKIDEPVLTLWPTSKSPLPNEPSLTSEAFEFLKEISIPLYILIGCIMFICAINRLVNCCMNKHKSQQFQVKNRFDFRYGSERRAFLKNSSKPVILDADQKSLSMGGTPQHRAMLIKAGKRHSPTSWQPYERLGITLPMHQLVQLSQENRQNPSRDVMNESNFYPQTDEPAIGTCDTGFSFTTDYGHCGEITIDTSRATSGD